MYEILYIFCGLIVGGITMRNLHNEGDLDSRILFQMPIQLGLVFLGVAAAWPGVLVIWTVGNYIKYIGRDKGSDYRVSQQDRESTWES